MMTWQKIRRETGKEGTTIVYRGYKNEQPTNYAIESRKRHILHADGRGTWDHTTYMVLFNGNEIREFQSMRRAKAYAEEL